MKYLIYKAISAKWVIVFLTGLLIFALVRCASAPDTAPPLDAIVTYKDIPGVTAEEIDAIEALRAGRSVFIYGALLSTESYVLPDGSIAGFAQKVGGLLTKLFDFEFVVELFEWDELISGLEARSVDFTGELTPTEERLLAYAMTDPIAERLLRIFISTDSEIGTESDLEGRTIGFLEGTVTADDIRRVTNLSFAVVDIHDYSMAASMIKSGEIDAFIDEATADPAFYEYDFIRSKIVFPMIYSPVSLTTANPDLRPIITVFDKYLNAGGRDILYSFYVEGDFAYAKNKLHSAFTPEERAYIDDLLLRGASVRVAFEHDNYPVSFYNETERAFEGIAVDVLAEISKLTGIVFEPIPIKNITWEEIFKKLLSGEILMTAELLRSPEWKGRFIWSATPYASTHCALLSRIDRPNLASYQVPRAIVGVKKQSAYVDIYNLLFPNANNLVAFDTQFEALDALANGEIDLLMASEFDLLAQTNFREHSGLKINIRLNAKKDSYFGFHMDETLPLRSIIDKAQYYVDTEIIEINWLGRQFDYLKVLTEQRAFYMTLFINMLSVSLIIAVFLLVKNIRLGKKLKEIANNDSLTGIFNRRFFLELAAINATRCARTGVDCYIVIFDLDHFKAVNDTYGHLAGDKVLKEIVHRVKACLRPYDILGRFGGEEFIILMTDIKNNNKEHVLTVTDRIRKEICRTPVEFEGQGIAISASFGISIAAPIYDLQTATQLADNALYQAKKEGRNRVVLSKAYEGKYE